jgi:hypothetical protein
MAKESTNKNAYMVPTISYASVANYTCDYVVAIALVHSAPRAAFWFSKDSKLSLDFVRV